MDLALLSVPNTPPAGHTFSPAQRLFGRVLRSNLPQPITTLEPHHSPHDIVVVVSTIHCCKYGKNVNHGTVACDCALAIHDLTLIWTAHLELSQTLMILCFFFVLAIVLVVVPSIGKKRGMLLVTRHAIGYPWCFSVVPRAWHSRHLDSH